MDDKKQDDCSSKGDAEGCIFCRIVKGELPSAKIYEDDDILAFLDIAPKNKGHTLVIPKRHYETLLDVPEEVMVKLSLATKKVAMGVVDATDCGGFNVNQNNFKIAGQCVMHLANHIIPRFKRGGFRFWPSGKYAEGEIEEWRQKIAAVLDPKLNVFGEDQGQEDL